MKKERKRILITALTALCMVVLLGSCNDEDNGIDGVCPEVLSTIPMDGESGVPLNQVISASFNEAMNPATITQGSLSLSSGASSAGGRVDAEVTGTVSYDEASNTISFVPDEDLNAKVVYTATIPAGVKDKMGNALQAPYIWTFSTGVSPFITTTSPQNLATNVAADKVVTATFSEAMNPATLNSSTFSLKAGTTAVAGAVTYSGNTVSFTSTSDLMANTTYTATITTAAKNLSDVSIAFDYIWSFNTGVAPTVVSTIPLDLATNVNVNQVVSAEFSEAMDPLTLTTSSFTLMDGAVVVPGSVSYSGMTAAYTPTSNLNAATTYTATVTTSVKSATGLFLVNDVVWTFSTGATAVPTVLSTVPLNLASNVPLNQVLSATFSEAMDGLTITSSSFTLLLGTNSVAGTVNYSGNTATFTPNSNLLSGNTYTATITTLAQSAAGVALANDYVWSFSTQAPLGPVAINLNSLENYGIIAGVGVSNQAGPSEIHDMDVGIYPGARSSITGFFVVDGGPGLIFNGVFKAADDGGAINAELNQAQLELVQAYNDAAGATFPAPSIAPADLGGKTLAPGIYTSASTMLLQNGDLTLDAQGDENAVWIFQIGSGFTSIGGAGGNVILSGGAKAKNVFWQVSSSAIIGDDTIFKGNILAFSSITMNSGAVAEGRMLARNAAVVLTSTNIITRPAN
jgi:hypothetical protein